MTVLFFSALCSSVHLVIQEATRYRKHSSDISVLKLFSINMQTKTLSAGNHHHLTVLCKDKIILIVYIILALLIEGNKHKVASELFRTALCHGSLEDSLKNDFTRNGNAGRKK